MQHVPEGVIQAPESPDAPGGAAGGVVPFLMMTCAPWCTRLLYRPGEISLCRLSTGNGIWPSVCDRNGYAYGCPEFQPNIIHP